MSAGVAVALVVGLFFVAGITVGVVAVIALSAVRRDRRTDLTGPEGRQRGPDEHAS